ncbi:MAG: nucleotide sugar dehydrogenase [Halobacteriota archaeon]
MNLKRQSGGLSTDLGQKIRDRSATIAVIGMGYVGLPTAVNFAEQGFKVIGVNRTPEKVELINKGGCYLKDLNIDERVSGVVQSKNLTATTDTAEATRKSDAIVVTVPTPITSDKRPDLSFIVAAGHEISKGLGRGKLVVLESTVYPGVVDDVLKPALEQSGLQAGTDFGLSYCPERYNPGDSQHGIADTVRIVSGITPEWTAITALLYQSNAKDVVPVKSIKTAEAAKVIENVQRDLNIALMNELALIFERLQIDIMDVIKAAATKWNFNVYYPGAGVGGHCLPVDPYYLVHKAVELGYHPQLITAGRAINDYMPMHVLQLIVDALNERGRAVNHSKTAILGFSYKENVGDFRESPTEVLIKELKRRGAGVHLVDPFVDQSILSKFATPEKTAYDALDAADTLVLMTAHSDFEGLDLVRIKDTMRTAIIVDGRRFFDPERARRLGFIYKGIGAKND